MSQPAQGQPSLDREPSPWTRPWFMVSAAIVAVLVALGVLYVVLPSPGAAPAPAQSPAVTATSTAQAGQTGQESICGLPAGDQRYPSLNLPTRWELLGRVAVPTDSKGVGPGKVDGNVRTCFQHSPTGALYASANIVGTGLLPNGSALVLKNLAAKSPMRDQALATPSVSETTDPPWSMQIAGFKVLSYTGDTARVSLGLKLTTQDGRTGFGAMTFGLRWEGADWKAVSEETSNSSGLKDLSDFVPWTGV
jgi:hypothetical protein